MTVGKWGTITFYADKWLSLILSNIALSLFACAQDQRQFKDSNKLKPKKIVKKKWILNH